MRSVPARAGTIEKRRVIVACGRPSRRRSSTCGGSAKTCAPSPTGSTSSGTDAAPAPSTVASTTTVAASPARAACGTVA